MKPYIIGAATGAVLFAALTPESIRLRGPAEIRGENADYLKRHLTNQIKWKPSKTNFVGPVYQTTNGLLFLKRLPNGSYDFMTLEDAIKEIGAATLVNHLVTNGVVCQVRGHKWQAHINTYPIHYENGPPQFRQCAVCEIVQSRSWGGWGK